jgi:hypothetical protein
MNDDHLAAWLLDVHGNPVGEPQRYFYDLSGTVVHRDAQLRHALTRLLHHARRWGAALIAVEDLDFTDGTSREKHGRNKRFRRLISRFPTAGLKARLVSMAAEQLSELQERIDSPTLPARGHFLLGEAGGHGATHTVTWKLHRPGNRP